MTITRSVDPHDPTDRYHIGCFLKMLMYDRKDEDFDEEMIREFGLDRESWEEHGDAWVRLPLGKSQTKFRELYRKAPENIRRMFQMAFVPHATNYIHDIANNLREMDSGLAETLDRHVEELDALIYRAKMKLFGLGFPTGPGLGEREQRHIDLEDDG